MIMETRKEIYSVMSSDSTTFENTNFKVFAVVSVDTKGKIFSTRLELVVNGMSTFTLLHDYLFSKVGDICHYKLPSHIESYFYGKGWTMFNNFSVAMHLLVNSGVTTDGIYSAIDDLRDTKTKEHFDTYVDSIMLLFLGLKNIFE